MKNYLTLLFSILLLFTACKKDKNKSPENSSVAIEKQNTTTAIITPISHATAVLQYNNEVIYLDPTGGKTAFTSFEAPNFVIITDVHGDHMNKKTLSSLDLSKSTIIAPQAVISQLENIKAKEKIVIQNGEEKSFAHFKIKAIPMYNLRTEALKFHPKGRGNGYVITAGKERIYFSGDTEDIPEMRQLKNIDKAFVCMNLPYTMTVESAANAVLDFKPKQVYPYHYRGNKGKSDVAKFKQLVNKENTSIEVVQLNWYQ